MPNKLCCLAGRIQSTTKMKKLALKNFTVFIATELISVWWHLAGSLTLNHLQICYFISSSCSSFAFFLSRITSVQLSASHSDTSQEKVLGCLPCPPSSVNARKFKGSTGGRCMGKSEVIPSPSSHKAPSPYNGTHVLEHDVSCTLPC